MFKLSLSLAIIIYNIFYSSQSLVEPGVECSTIEDDVLLLIGKVVNETEPTSVCIIADSIYADHFGQEFVSSLSNRLIITMYIEDSESFEDEPSKKVQSMLIAMKEIKCEFYVILVINGTQAAELLKYADDNRLLATRARILLLYDIRLFSPDLLFIWKRFINVIFIRECNTKFRNWYEMSTVPFPAPIQDVFVPKVINFWSPPNHYRWQKKKLDDKFDHHLNGLKLIVAILEHTPTVFKTTVSRGDIATVEYSGLEIDLIQTLSSAMNFSIEFYEPPDLDEKWGRKVGNNNFTGLLRVMDEAQADAALGDLHYTMFNLGIIDLSLPYNIECLTFITPEQQNDNSWKTLLSPFGLGMWIGVLLSLGLVGIIFFTFSKSYVVIKNTSATRLVTKDFFDDLSACVLYTYSMILLVSLPRMPARWSVRVLTGWWWIYCILVVVAYRASLTSILANPQPRVTIDTLEVLGKSWLKVGAWGDQNKEFFTMSVDAAAQSIGTKLEHVDDGYLAIDRVAAGDFAYFENQFTLQELRFLHEEDKKESASNLHIMETCAVNIPISIGLGKNSPFKKQMDKNIRRLIEGGLIQKWLTQAINKFQSSVEPPPPEALMDIKKFYGALVTLGCGYAVATLAFVFEKIYWHFVVERHPNYDKYHCKIVAPQTLK